MVTRKIILLVIVVLCMNVNAFADETPVTSPSEAGPACNATFYDCQDKML